MTENKVISPEAIPNVGSREVTIDGKPYLVANDAMFTFYQRSMGEMSPFFLALRDEKKLLGCRCTKCGIVRVPPFVTRCPDCDFAPTEMVEVGDVGTMLSTPPITYFANSLFQKQVPFGRGRLVPEGADTAMSVNFYTTKGILVPGLVRKGTEMKVVFRDERIGDITDIFCIPISELTADQVKKKGLTESELNWERGEEPSLPEATDADQARYNTLRGELSGLIAEMNACERASKDIADWQRVIAIKATGGSLTLTIKDGTLALADGAPGTPDFTMVCRDLGVLVDGLGYRGSLTQAIITRDLWISKNVEFTTVFKLERMSRSLARSKKT